MPASRPALPLLETTDMNAYYGYAHILFDVNLRVDAGEVVALLGRNGAGKSTTMKAIIGLLRGVEGQIRFGGEEISNEATYAISRRGVAYVPEERRIFANLTVLENLEVGRRARGSDASRWTTERIFELFPNLAERQHHLGSRISGGEQQMLTIARGLMGNPKIMLLDEPSEGIAPIIVDQMTRVIGQLKRDGIGILLSEQNLSFAKRVSDRAYVMEKGVIRFAGTIADLTSRRELADAYLAV